MPVGRATPVMIAHLCSTDLASIFTAVESKRDAEAPLPLQSPAKPPRVNPNPTEEVKPWLNPSLVFRKRDAASARTLALPGNQRSATLEDISLRISSRSQRPGSSDQASTRKPSRQAHETVLEGMQRAMQEGRFGGVSAGVRTCRLV